MPSYKIATQSSRLANLLPSSILYPFNKEQITEIPSSQFNITITFTLLAIIATILALQYVFGGPKGFSPPQGNKARKIYSIVPALGQVGFYGPNRPSWIQHHLGDVTKPESIPPLRMNLRSNVVTVVSGTQSAKSFFSNRDLNFVKGFQGLMAGIPRPERSIDDVQGEVNEKMISLEEPAPKAENMFNQWTNKHLRNCLSDKRLIQHDVMKKVAKDIFEGLQDIWKNDSIDPSIVGSRGLIDMQAQLYWIIFRVSIRIVSSTELAEDKSILTPMMDNYWIIETHNGYWNTQFPNLPIPSNRRRKRAGAELHKLLRTPIETRMQKGNREDDYTQLMIDANNSAMDITLWQTGMLFASIINSSAMFAWTLAFTSANPKIWEKMKNEIDQTLTKLNKENGITSSSSSTILDQISNISIEQLEENFNFTYFCIRESIRILSNEMLYRLMEPKQPGATGKVGGETIRDGEYLAFNAATINMSSTIYTNPYAYDPSRWERNEGSGPYEFVGWGTGLHPCIGMKLAKNELKMGLAFVVSMMDIKPINPKTGEIYTSDNLPIPKPYRGGYRAPNGPLKLQYTVR